MKYSLLVVVIALGAAIFLGLLATSGVPLLFSPRETLAALWESYKTNDLEAGTLRTVDASRGGITTSEGESYTMLRAAWVGDKATFDASWQWTKNNLQHKSGDHLMAWLFGQRPDGTYGVLLDQGGEHAASDADTNIALALLFAYARWQDPRYLGDADAIIHDIWGREVVEIGGTPYLAADDLEKEASSTSALINPSYLEPAAYRAFALADSGDDWSGLITSSYRVITESSKASLGARSSAGLPPDWVAVDKTTGALSPASAPADANFGFDALRVPYNLALDYEWSNDPRDLSALSAFSFLDQEWKRNGFLATTYSHEGGVVEGEETYAMYGGTLGYFLFEDPPAARAIYKHKITTGYDAGVHGWNPPRVYYDDNWSWFAVGLYNDLLPDLAATLPPEAYE